MCSCSLRLWCVLTYMLHVWLILGPANSEITLATKWMRREALSQPQNVFLPCQWSFPEASAAMQDVCCVTGFCRTGEREGGRWERCFCWCSFCCSRKAINGCEPMARNGQATTHDLLAQRVRPHNSLQLRPSFNWALANCRAFSILQCQWLLIFSDTPEPCFKFSENTLH